MKRFVCNYIDSNELRVSSMVLELVMLRAGELHCGLNYDKIGDVLLDLCVN